jgi:hypothetical protein
MVWDNDGETIADQIFERDVLDRRCAMALGDAMR